MICSVCGAQNDDQAKFCAACGAQLNIQTPNGNHTAPAYRPQQPGMYPPHIQPRPINSTPYLIFAIITTVLCCLPLGIPAIVYASRIDSALKLGDYYGAQDAAKKAKLFCILSAAISVVVVLLYFFIFFIGLLPWYM